ncbi:MAG TPA: hypothetical protein VFP68_03600 [Burkholderiaceae bacterium]|nr:hypothetical protein [Burkholderiaceae bacterium]
MRPDLYSSGVTSLRYATDAAAASAAQAGAEAARVANMPLSPQARAIEGFRLAASTAPSGAGIQAQAMADAATNARNAMLRTDLPPEQAQQLRLTLEHLGNAVIDGKIDPHINNAFRQHLYDLATARPGSAEFKGAMSQMHRAAQVLEQVDLAGGTRLAYDPRHNGDTGRTGLPLLDVPDIDADLYFKTRDGTLHVESTKYGANTLANELSGDRTAKVSQTGRQAEWRTQAAPDTGRAVHYYMFDEKADFTTLLSKPNLDQLEKAVGDPVARRIVIGERAYSISDLRQISADGIAKAQPELKAFRAQWEQANPGKSFNAIEYFRAHMRTPEQAMQTLGKSYGEPVSRLGPTRIPAPELPSVRQGAAFGALAGGAVSMISLGVNGQLNLSNAGEVLKQTAAGAALGATAAQGERLLTPVIDRAMGPAIERAGASVAARAGSVAAVDAAGTSVALRTLATRAAGSTAVGAVLSAGVSTYENREGLARGDSKAIGNVAADTTVGAASVAASVAAGAAIGSVVPVAGTAVGAAAGLVVGVGVAYGAQISGARDAVADAVSGAVDEIKSWF